MKTLTKLHGFSPELELVELEQVRLLGLVPQGGEHSPLLGPRLAGQADGFLQFCGCLDLQEIAPQFYS
jgi:hypothetical protein